MGDFGGVFLNKGDLFTVYLDGNIITVCVLGSYHEEYSGEEMLIIAVVSQENLVHIPIKEINALLPKKKYQH